MRLAVDTGGTFTDLVVEADSVFRLFKSPTTPDDPAMGVLDVLAVAADGLGISRQELLEASELFVYGTTRAINAILTGATARTAFLTTRGHPDVLLFREGGRTEPFNQRRTYPSGYVSRSLTWQVPERIDPQGAILEPLDEAAVLDIIGEMRRSAVEAVAVCLLWSISNAVHEVRVGELLDEHLPGVPVTLSHVLNPTIREYRRASATAIDASLKPLMTQHLGELESRLRAAGLSAPMFVVTSSGGVMELPAVAAAPIHVITSGPAMAPVAGRTYANADAQEDSAVIVTDTGGTSYDVSLVRRGRIPRTRETWLGERFVGHITGFPSVSVNSIGAGGGSIAWVDDGGMLHVGPDSAGAEPGPACYGRGGERPTVTDAGLVLGYLDRASFLGGAMELDIDAARTAIRARVAEPLGLTLPVAGAAVFEVVTEQMVHAIEELTVNQGIDPRTAVLVGGGGAAGLNSVAIARRLGCRGVVFPAVGAALSAAGALLSDLVCEFSAAQVASSAAFDHATVNRTLSELGSKCDEFLMASGAGLGVGQRIDYWAEARYPHQVWELELPLRSGELKDTAAVDELVQDFHELHRDVFAVDDPDSAVEIAGWHARARVSLRDELPTPVVQVNQPNSSRSRVAYFPDLGEVSTPVHDLAELVPGRDLRGPAIIEADLTTIVLPSRVSARRSATGGVLVTEDTNDPERPS